MSRFLAYHERIGGCNIYCRGNLHAGIVYLNDELAGDLSKALAFMREPFPDVRRVVELARVPEADHGSRSTSYAGKFGVFVAHERPADQLAYRYLVELEATT